MGTVISNLKARFSVETGDWKKGMSDGEKSLMDFDKKVGSTITGLGKMLSPIALLAGAGGAIATLKKAIESVEGPGDRFKAAIGGGKEALYEFQKALGTMNFSGFFTNLKEGYDRGKQFTEALDELADRAAYNDYKIAQLNRDSEALQEITKDKTKEISVRAAAAEKVKEIEAKIVKRKIELAQEEFNIAKGQWESRNKMEADEAVKLYETIDNMGPELKKRLQKAFEGATGNQLGSVKKGIQSVLFGQYDPQLVKEVDAGTLESYSRFFALIEGGENDVLIKLFNTFKAIDEKGYQAQKEYNGVVASTTKLMAAEDKQANANLKTKEKINEKDKEAIALANAKADQIGITRADISNIKIPDLATPLNNALAPLAAVKEGLKDLKIELSAGLEAALESAAISFGEFLGALMMGDAAARDFGLMMVGAFADLAITIGKLTIASAITIGVLDKILKNPATWPAALAAGIALVAVGSAVRGSLAKISEGKSGGGGSVSGGSGGENFTFDTRKLNAADSFQFPKTITLVAKGSDLVGVLNFENIRKRITT